MVGGFNFFFYSLLKEDKNIDFIVKGEGEKPLFKLLSAIKNKIDIKLEEHVFVEEEDEIAFDHHGHEIKFPFKINSKTVENYPKRILEKNQENIKKPEITNDTAIEKLLSQLKKPVETDVRDITEEFVLREINEVYVPIFEARLNGPKKKVGIIRIDAVRNKIL